MPKAHCSNVAPGPQDRSNGSLSPITADTLSGRNRAASVKSNRSGTTIVEDGSHSGEEDHKLTGQFSRTGTLDIDIKPVSRLEFLLGLFGPEKMTRKIAQKAKINGVDNYEYEVINICQKNTSQKLTHYVV